MEEGRQVVTNHERNIAEPEEGKRLALSAQAIDEIMTRYSETGYRNRQDAVSILGSADAFARFISWRGKRTPLEGAQDMMHLLATWIVRGHGLTNVQFRYLIGKLESEFDSKCVAGLVLDLANDICRVANMRKKEDCDGVGEMLNCLDGLFAKSPAVRISEIDHPGLCSILVRNTVKTCFETWFPRIEAKSPLNILTSAVESMSHWRMADVLDRLAPVFDRESIISSLQVISHGRSWYGLMYVGTSVVYRFECIDGDHCCQHPPLHKCGRALALTGDNTGKLVSVPFCCKGCRLGTDSVILSAANLNNSLPLTVPPETRFLDLVPTSPLCPMAYRIYPSIASVERNDPASIHHNRHCYVLWKDDGPKILEFEDALPNKLHESNIKLPSEDKLPAPVTDLLHPRQYAAPIIHIMAFSDEEIRRTRQGEKRKLETSCPV